jgi:predicted Zn-dependent protease
VVDRHLRGRVDILDHAGNRFASLEHQLDGFDEALNQTVESIQLRSPQQDAFRRSHDLYLKWLLFGAGFVVAGVVFDQDQFLAAGVVSLAGVIQHFAQSTRLLLLDPHGIEVRAAGKSVRIPWRMIGEPELILSEQRIDVQVAGTIPITPVGANAFHVWAAIRERLERGKVAEASEPQVSPAALFQADPAKRFPGWTLLLLVVVPALPLGLTGSVSAKFLGGLLLGFVGIKLLSLVREFREAPTGAEEVERFRGELITDYRNMRAEERAQEAWVLGLDGERSSDELAQATIGVWWNSNWVARPRRTIACEAAGLLGIALLAPLAALLHTADIVALRISVGWLGLGVVALCAGLYALPLLGAASVDAARKIWWVLPFVPVLLWVHRGIAVEHPYLDPTRDDRTRLAAERVLSLRSNIAQAAYADWVFAYAHELEERGDREAAVRYYIQGLRLDPYNQAERARLARLKGNGRGAMPPGAVHAVNERAHEPLLPDGYAVKPLPRCRLDSSLSELDRTIVILARIGEVDDWLLDAVGEVIQREVGLSACVVEEAVPLPPHTRRHSLFIGRQWSLRSLATAFMDHLDMALSTPAMFVFLTPVDIYGEKSNYVFASSYSFGAIVSFARFGDPVDEKLLVASRTAKQALGSLIKSFGVPVSSDPDCVTSYPRNLAEFDAKGNRPNAESRALFRQSLAKRNLDWANYRDATGTPGGG